MTRAVPDVVVVVPEVIETSPVAVIVASGSTVDSASEFAFENAKLPAKTPKRLWYQ